MSPIDEAKGRGKKRPVFTKILKIFEKEQFQINKVNRCRWAKRKNSMRIKYKTNENCHFWGFFLEPIQELHVPGKAINSIKKPRNLSKPLNKQTSEKLLFIPIWASFQR